MITVAAFTGGIDVASARFRVRQYIAPLERHGISVHEFPAPFGSFPPSSKWRRPGWGIASLASRVPALLRSYSCDLALFQREMLSTFVTLEGVSRSPRVLDVDDAIWLFMGDKRARRLAEKMDCVICGNQFLADYFSAAGSSVFVVPTGVDIDRFYPRTHDGHSEVVIGWSGGSGAFAELVRIEDQLAAVLARHHNVKLHVIADSKPELRKLPQDRFLFTEWSRAVEVEAFQSIDIGIMPLSDSTWNRGKCSYKMLLHMACGSPVVVSPIGMNADVLRLGEFGFAAKSSQDWCDRLETLVTSPELRSAYGRTGRNVIEAYFSLEVLAPLFAEAISIAK